MKTWTKLTMREKTQYCLQNKLTIKLGQIRYENQLSLKKDGKITSEEYFSNLNENKVNIN